MPISRAQRLASGLRDRTQIKQIARLHPTCVLSLLAPPAFSVVLSTKNSRMLVMKVSDLLVYHTSVFDNWPACGCIYSDIDHAISLCQFPLCETAFGSNDDLLNLTDFAAVDAFVDEHNPQAIIHCAAERRPDVAERDQDGTKTVCKPYPLRISSP
ncbi:hypothetical protein BC937DRAFT_88147 [Endogone sp. FLAS-F59071]|nr:hypothetical protein BC937DRAFT_88147 [Endogone sp. FLAS-F59071]|eukprot:RUS18945.1 hypothetical protein BC937DRAFT_88147 [Endogone sp. FLAS-F59071]